MNRFFLAPVLLAFAIASAAHAEGGASLPPVDDPATLKECGACHIPYQPQMLPARSWRAIMADLGSHFGDNATLRDKIRAEIEAYLVANAADAPVNMAYGWQFLRGIQPDTTPLRITQTGFWNRAHGEIPDAVFADPRVKLRSNCLACHAGARQGQFGEEE
jgi:hypothetical protein